MIAFTFGAGPFDTPLFIPEFGDLFPPYRNGAQHHPLAGFQPEVFNFFTRPVPALVAGVKSFGFHAIPDFAHLAIYIEILWRIGLHAAGAGGFFGSGAVKTPHHGLEFFIVVPVGNIDPAGAAIQSAWCH